MSKSGVCKEGQELKATMARAWAAALGSLLKEKLSNHCCVLSELLESTSPPSTSRFGAICRPGQCLQSISHYNRFSGPKGYFRQVG